jgi:hypothetical protein
MNWNDLFNLYHLKSNPTTITYYGTTMKSEADPPLCNRLSQPSPVTLEKKITLVARPLITPVAQKLCRCEYGVFTNRTSVHYRTLLASKSFAAVREAFSNTYSDKEVQNQTTIHRLVTELRYKEEICPASDSVDRCKAALYVLPSKRKLKNNLLY